MKEEPGALGENRHRHPLDLVVRIALEVPGLAVGLGVPRRVDGLAAQLVIAGFGIPFERPLLPRGRERLGRHRGLAPLAAAIRGAPPGPPPPPRPPSALNSTRSMGPHPDQARPLTSCRPGCTILALL